MTITFTPYRGKIEPVTKIHKAEIKLYPLYVEIIFAYEYERFSEGVRQMDDIHGAYFINRYDMNLLRSSMYHQDDPERELVPYVALEVAGVSDTIYIRCKNNKEADSIYEQLKDYMLML